MEKSSYINLLIKILVSAIILTIIIFIVSLLSNNNNNDIVENNEILEQGISLSTNKVHLYVGESITVNASVIPPNATYKNLIWTSMNSDIATVNNGVISGINKGTCMIHVATEKQKIYQIISVTVEKTTVDVENINIKDSNIEMFVGDTYKIEYTIEPQDATNKTVSFKSANPSIAAINQNQEIIGLSEGQTVITILADNNISKKINVTVNPKNISVNNVTLNKSTLTINVGNSETLTAIAEPHNAIDRTITWSSSNGNVATVNNGIVTGKNAGTTTITATSKNGKTASCIVTVIKPYIPPLIIETYERPITTNSNFSGFADIASCDSSSLKYRIIDFYGDDWVLVWVKHPNKQINSALAYGTGNQSESADAILAGEINSYGYQNKCMVAANSSFFNMSNGSVLGGIIMSKGHVIRNNGGGTLIGVTSSGELKEYIDRPISALQSDGVRNTFGHSHRIIPKNVNENDRTNRNIICQINKNNFILVSGSGTPNKIAYDVNRMAGNATCFNLDGGGSRKLYFKTQNSSMIKRFGGTRKIPDMIYFVEE